MASGRGTDLALGCLWLLIGVLVAVAYLSGAAWFWFIPKDPTD